MRSCPHEVIPATKKRFCYQKALHVADKVGHPVLPPEAYHPRPATRGRPPEARRPATRARPPEACPPLTTAGRRPAAPARGPTAGRRPGTTTSPAQWDDRLDFVTLDVGGKDRLHDDEAPEHRESVAGRISSIIDAFDSTSPTLSLSQLTERTGLPKSTVHRMADQLVELRWLERTSTGYRLGMRFFEVGGLVAMRNHLRERALPFLQDLQASTHHSVHLGLLEGSDVVILEKLWGHGAPSLPTRVGGRMPAHCTAAGKALLAFAPEKVVEDVISRGLERRTGRTIVVPELFRQELATVRTAHWALETEENVAGLRCVAAPIRGSGRAISAVSVSGPVHKVDVSRVVPLVRRCAADIWDQLFGRHAPPGGSGSAAALDGETYNPWDVEQWRDWLEQIAGEWM